MPHQLVVLDALFLELLQALLLLLLNLPLLDSAQLVVCHAIEVVLPMTTS
jgi:hypothetical protein